MKNFGTLDKPFDVMKGRKPGDIVTFHGVPENQQNELVLLSDLTRFSLGYLKNLKDGTYQILSIPWQNK